MPSTSQRIQFHLLAVAAALPLVAGVAVASDFAEPGFEVPALPSGTYVYNPTPGLSAWTYLGAAGLSHPPDAFTNFVPPEGSQIAFLQTFGSGATAAVCQTVTTLAPGVEHFFTAQLALRLTCGSCVGPADVEFTLDGNVLLTVPGPDITSAGFKPFLARFTPSSTSGLLCVQEPPAEGLLDVTNFVDDVHVGVLGIFADGFESP